MCITNGLKYKEGREVDEAVNGNRDQFTKVQAMELALDTIVIVKAGDRRAKKIFVLYMYLFMHLVKNYFLRLHHPCTNFKIQSGYRESLSSHYWLLLL